MFSILLMQNLLILILSSQISFKLKLRNDLKVETQIKCFMQLNQCLNLDFEKKIKEQMKIILSAQYFEIFQILSSGKFFTKNIMELKEFEIP